MLKIILALLFVVMVLLFIPSFSAWFLERTSGFEGELTRDGGIEQKLWREQRSRNLRGLTLRSHQRFEKSPPDGSQRS
jgi:hypothetical protein